MLSHHDENELLAIIEGELDDERLSHDPQVRALVQQMKRDRDLLRSEPEPQMPHDLAAKIEQALTRPMLMAAWGEDDPAAESLIHTGERGLPAARPGEFRRHHHRPARIRRAVRLALAACIGILFISGAWLGIDTLLNLRAEHAGMIAQHESDPDAGDAVAMNHAAQEEAWPPAGSTVHHYAPQPVLERYVASRLTGAAHEPEPSGEAVAVEFALFIDAEEPEAIETALGELLRSMETAAFVQHMSKAEARRIFDEFQASVATRGESQPRHEPTTSRPIVGSRAMAPDFAQQLDYAVRGATHTVTIRLSQLPALLEEVERQTKSSALRQLPGLIDAGPGDWLKDRALIRGAIAELARDGRDPLIHLPIVLERN